MSTKHTGSCLCKQIKFVIKGEFENFYLCHCDYCRKDTGSAHAANLFSTTAKLKWLSGQSEITTFNLPATRHVKSFCSLCGSAMPTQQLDGKLLVVPAGSLDSDLTIKPDAHLFVASKASWDEQLENVPTIMSTPS